MSHPLRPSAAPAAPSLALRAELAITGEDRAGLAARLQELRDLVGAIDCAGVSGAEGEELFDALRVAIVKSASALREHAAAPLFAQLETLAGRAMAPFHESFAEACRAYHGTPAAAALQRLLAPDCLYLRDNQDLPAIADRLSAALEAALAGCLTFEFEGAEVPA